MSSVAAISSGKSNNKSLLLQKLEGGNRGASDDDYGTTTATAEILASQCENEIRELHRLFVTWFRGERPVQELESDLCDRLLPTFSHVAPNGHMVKGRDVLLQYLTDKYGCYQDRVFSIDVYNVQLLWNAGTKCLASYEEWQSWDSIDEEEGDVDDDEYDHHHQGGGGPANQSNNNNKSDGSTLLGEASDGGYSKATSLGSNGKQQFGRLSTCLLEKDKNDGQFRWIHVHETWLEAEEPVVNTNLSNSSNTNNNNNNKNAVLDDDATVMTGPVPPSELSKRLAKQNQQMQQQMMNDNNTDASAESSSLLLEKTNEEKSVVVKKCTILLSNQSLSKEQTMNQEHAMDVLKGELLSNDEFEELFEVVDATNPTQRNRRNELTTISKLSKNPTYPQFFVTDINNGCTTFWGTYNDFDNAYKNGSLLVELGIRDPVVQEATTTKNDPPQENEKAINSTTLSSASPTKGKKRPTIRDTKTSVDDDDNIDPERAFLEKSQGILMFEDEDDDDNILPNPYGAGTGNMNNNNNNNSSSAPFYPRVSFTPGTSGVSGGGDDPNNDSTTMMMDENSILDTLTIPPDASKKRHINPKLERFGKPLVWENALVGISIKGFDIGTSQGVVADSIWLTDTTQQLESIAQSFSIPIPKRKLNLPEMIYSTAHVALEGHGLWLSWDATDALEAWAKCHQMIAVKSRISWEGVNVLKTKDAKLWEKNAAERSNKNGAQQLQPEGGGQTTVTQTRSGSSDDDMNNNNNGNNNGIDSNKNTTASAAIFHYDWTFSTPFIVKAEGGEWVELDESGMRMELLKDQSVPILFFDEILLYEDDLHDNGTVQYSVKIRVMPTCSYILARLFVRVDNVILRVRETRVLIDFFGIKPSIYRDITWKECHWDQLKQHNLPTDISSWTCADTKVSPQKVQEWSQLIQQLPDVRLPKNYYQYAVFEY